MTCPDRNAAIFEKHGMLLDNNVTKHVGKVAVFSTEYFNPSYFDPKKFATENTYSVHHFAASWYSKGEKKRRRKMIRERKIKSKRRRIVNAMKEIIRKTIGRSNYERIKHFLNK